MRIKNWEKFQHYKTRKPPWIKLYRDLLEDKEWNCLQPASNRLLVELWILASEGGGVLPPIGDISFRLRKSEVEINRLIPTLSHWLEHDASNMIADRKQSAMPETETEREREREEEAPPNPQGGAIEIPSDLEPYSQKIKDWLAYKRERGENYKPRGLRALWAKIRTFPAHLVNSSIDQCMACNYAGLFLKNYDSALTETWENRKPKRHVILVQEEGVASES